MNKKLKIKKKRIIKTDGSFITINSNLKKKNIGILKPVETKLAEEKQPKQN